MAPGLQVEASGANSAIRSTDLASFICRRIAYTGWPKQETSLPTNLITFKELDLRGSRTSAGEFEEALQMLSTLNINPADIVSKVVTIDEVPEAVKELDQFPERYLKINVKFILIIINKNKSLTRSVYSLRVFCNAP